MYSTSWIKKVGKKKKKKCQKRKRKTNYKKLVDLSDPTT